MKKNEVESDHLEGQVANTGQFEGFVRIINALPEDQEKTMDEIKPG